MMATRSILMESARWLALAVLIVLVGLSGPSSVGAQQAEDSTADEPLAESVAGCPCGRTADDGEMGCGRRGAGNGEARIGAGRGPGMRSAMGAGHGRKMGRGGGPPAEREAIHALVHEFRQDIVREIEDVEGGVATVTRSPDNAEAAAMLQRHVAEMKRLVETGGRIRGWDPLFSELFDHYQEIDMVIEPLADGVRVVETSANPEVVKLIRTHARRVSDFLARGPEAVHGSTAMPADYEEDAAESADDG